MQLPLYLLWFAEVFLFHVFYTSQKEGNLTRKRDWKRYTRQNRHSESLFCLSRQKWHFTWSSSFPIKDKKYFDTLFQKRQNWLKKWKTLPLALSLHCSKTPCESLCIALETLLTEDNPDDELSWLILCIKSFASLKAALMNERNSRSELTPRKVEST